MPAPQGRKRQASDAEIDQAVDAVRKKLVKSMYAAERQYGVPWATIWRRLKGKAKLRRRAHERDQLLSDQEEEALIGWCQELTRARHPLPRAMLCEMAQEIQVSRVARVQATTGVPICYPPIRVHWTQRFLKRHPDLKSVFCWQLDRQRWMKPTRRVLQ
jgi:hypothetical protein